jgi:hypothetical protein
VYWARKVERRGRGVNWRDESSDDCGDWVVGGNGFGGDFGSGADGFGEAADDVSGFDGDEAGERSAGVAER